MNMLRKGQVAAAVLAVGLLMGSGSMTMFDHQAGPDTFGAVSVSAKKHHKHKKPKHGHRKNGGNNIPPPPVPTLPPSPQPETRTFTNVAEVRIPEVGPAQTYPSEILVEGAGERITDIDVRIPGFRHDFPDDVDILLLGPEGQRVIVMADTGGLAKGGAAVDLRIDDQASAPLPPEGPLVSGTFRPTNDFGAAETEPDLFPSPAPAGLAARRLSAFNGTNPNGTWSLFVVDDQLADGGFLIGGWSLIVTTELPG